MTWSSQALLLPLPHFGSIIQQEHTLRLVLWLRGGMQILMKTLTGQTTSQRTLEVKTITLNLKASDTVLRLKVMIEKMEDIMPKKQHLTLMEELLVNNHAISDYNIQESAVLPLQIERGMHILITTWYNKSLPMDIVPIETIHFLKAMIQHQQGILPDQQA
jgi:ubiquitin C